MKFTLTLNLDSANVTIEALQQYRHLQWFNSQAKGATEGERLNSSRKVLVIETLLRQAGVEPEELNKA